MGFPYFLVCMFVFEVKEAADLPFQGDHGDNEEDPLVIEDDGEVPPQLANDADDPIDEVVDEVTDY